MIRYIRVLMLLVLVLQLTRCWTSSTENIDSSEVKSLAAGKTFSANLLAGLLGGFIPGIVAIVMVGGIVMTWN